MAGADDHKVKIYSDDTAEDVGFLEQVLESGNHITFTYGVNPPYPIQVNHNDPDPYTYNFDYQTVVVDVQHSSGDCAVRVFFKDHCWDDYGHTLGYDSDTDRWSYAYVPPP